MKKWYRNLVIAFAVIPAIAIIVTTCIGFTNLEPQPTKEDYDLLKDYSLQIASGTPIKEIEEKGVKATKDIKESSIEVKVQGDKCRVTTTILLSEEVARIENGKVYLEKSIEYGETSFLEESLVNTKFEHILYGISATVVWIAVILICFICIPDAHKKCLEEEAKQKAKK